MRLVDRVKSKSAEKGLNIKTLEQLSGLTNGQIGKWERQKPSYDKVAAVANTLNVSIDWLITGKESGDLTPEEQLLVDTFRNCNQIGQQAIQTAAEAMQKQFPAQDEQEQPAGVSTSAIG